MDLVKLLCCLADGEFHSGVELGAALGVSRTAVWKELGKLDSVGVALETVKGKGYRILGGVDLIDKPYLTNYWQSKSLPIGSFDLLQTVGSTNSYLMSDEQSVAASQYAVCMAERQTEGRGRRGRVWHSPFAKNLYISIAFNLVGGPEALEGLSLALGGAVAKCLADQGVGDIGLKWPNDVWVQGEKLAGILVELKGEAGEGWRVVVGLGVNVLMSDADGVPIDQPWVSLFSLDNGRGLCRSEWAAMLVESLIESVEQYKVDGLATMLDGWRQYDMLAGRLVEVVNGDVSGVCEGVDAKGRLLVSIDGTVRAINSGEVSVRPNES